MEIIHIKLYSFSLFFFFFLNSGYDFSSFSLCNMRGGSVSGMRRISLSQLALDNVGR